MLRLILKEGFINIPEKSMFSNVAKLVKAFLSFDGRYLNAYKLIQQKINQSKKYFSVDFEDESVYIKYDEKSLTFIVEMPDCEYKCCADTKTELLIWVKLLSQITKTDIAFVELDRIIKSENLKQSDRFKDIILHYST
eukprot:UN03276